VYKKIVQLQIIEHSKTKAQSQKKNSQDSSELVTDNSSNVNEASNSNLEIDLKLSSGNDIAINQEIKSQEKEKDETPSQTQEIPQENDNEIIDSQTLNTNENDTVHHQDSDTNEYLSVLLTIPSLSLDEVEELKTECQNRISTQIKDFIVKENEVPFFFPFLSFLNFKKKKKNLNSRNQS